jgi:tetratricopeptide (TPR) repeat protein
MQFDPDNNIVKLCAEGMGKEGEGKPEEAYQLFMRAWNEAISDFEKFTAAHYVVRHQKAIADKLRWDEVALGIALKINNEKVKSTYPSLYLNVAKCYEDLKNFQEAKKNYQLALFHTNSLQDDGYATMIKAGIANGIERLTQ